MNKHSTGSFLAYRTRIHNALEAALPSRFTHPTKLHEAIRYSVLNGGKRLRALLIYTIGEALKIDLIHLDHLACAVESIHAYTLVHDDLPAMDNSDLRRGVPACHIVFDEATALLAGNALLNFAYICINHLNHQLPSDACMRILNLLFETCYSEGILGGQSLDLSATSALSETQLLDIYTRKTAKLIQTSLQLPVLCEPSSERTDQLYRELGNYGETLGLFFQIQDDILDIESSTQSLGKPQGTDALNNKPTFPRLLGLDYAKTQLNELDKKLNRQLAQLGQTLNVDQLTRITDMIRNRSS